MDILGRAPPLLVIMTSKFLALDGRSGSTLKCSWRHATAANSSSDSSEFANQRRATSILAYVGKDESLGNWGAGKVVILVSRWKREEAEETTCQARARVIRLALSVSI